MSGNLLKPEWGDLDSPELRLLLDKWFRGPGQYKNPTDNPNTLYLPLADSSCRIVLTFRNDAIVAIEAGSSFDPSEWDRISEEVEKLILSSTSQVGREYSFSSHRVHGSWRGQNSGVQILPPPAEAPTASIESAEHPFILEFPLKVSEFWPITNYRRRDHRKLTLLLNVLLTARINVQPRQSQGFWTIEQGTFQSKWVQKSFFAKLDKPVVDELSSPSDKQIEELRPEEYYKMRGNDGQGMRVPNDLDASICTYLQLSAEDKEKFNRAAFWLDMASRQWEISISASFAALVSAIEALTIRGSSHQFECPICKERTQHEEKGAVRRLKDFLETYAPGAEMAERRGKVYALRSGILHGSKLMQLDENLAFGWDPPWWNQYELHNELWGVTVVALRNWLKSHA